MLEAVAVFLISLGLGQLVSTALRLQAASLVGASRWLGYLLGLGLLILGGLLLPYRFVVFLWIPFCGLLSFVILLLGGSFVWPPSDPHLIFEPNHPAHGTAQRVSIPDGENLIPGYLLTPPNGTGSEAAVCLIHGAGDTKTSYKWLLVNALLAEGFSILTIDLPGHGDYKYQMLTYPEVLSTIPTALQFLRSQSGVRWVGVIGISLGGAVAIRSLVEQKSTDSNLAEALVILETPVRLNYSQALFYREMWNTLYGTPTLWLLREMSVKQAWDTWQRGGYRSRYTTSQLFDLLAPLSNIGQLSHLPILLVYSRRDLVAPPDHALAMHQAVPQATLLETKKASHVGLTLMPEINRQVANWLKKQLIDDAS